MAPEQGFFHWKVGEDVEPRPKGAAAWVSSGFHKQMRHLTKEHERCRPPAAGPVSDGVRALADPKHTEQIMQLLTQYQRRLHVYIRSLVPNRTDAEEVLQEVNLFIWRQADEFKLGTDFGAWAYKIAYYHVLTYRKRLARQKLRFSDALMEQLAESAAASAEMTDQRQEALEKCIEKLRKEDRDLVRLRYEVGGTAQALANKLGRTAKAIYYALNRIHLSLLTCIERSLRSEAGS
jgi:RNA polymerase sigma-70 factor (ECF subfamily)